MLRRDQVPKLWTGCSFLCLYLLQLFKRSISEAALERISDLLESFSLLSPKEEPKGIS